MLSTNQKKLLLAIHAMQKDLHNANRRTVRRSYRAAYEAAWAIAKKELPFLSKNSNRNARSFKSRIRGIVSTAKLPMYFTLSAEVRSINAIHMVAGEKALPIQKGVPIAKRKRISFRKGFLASKNPFIAAVGTRKQSFVFTRIGPKKLQKVTITGLWALLDAKRYRILNAVERETS